MSVQSFLNINKNRIKRYYDWQIFMISDQDNCDLYSPTINNFTIVYRGIYFMFLAIYTYLLYK
jgi:hypothetical protein